jgi:hypothetical protein
VCHRFQIGRVLNGVLASPLPVDHRLSAKARLGVVMRQEFGLRLGGVGKARLQHLGNALMVLLARAAQQRLIGCVLDQGMLEDVHRLWRQPPLV